MSRFEQRRDKLRKLLRKRGAGGLLVTNFTNVTYLTGFTGDDSYLLVTTDGEVLLSDPRYTTQLEEECPGLELSIRWTGVSMLDAVAKVVKQSGLAQLGIEAGSMTVELFHQLADKLPKVELVSTQGLVEALRIIKDRAEVDAIRVAIDQARKGFDVIRASLTPDQTEKQVAADLEHQLRRFGAKGCSFTPIIAVGPRAALPHATPGDSRIGESDFVLVDWGAREGLYISDLTRMVVTGKISPKLERIYRVVLKAQVAAIQAIRPGISCEEVDGVARSIITKAGYGKQFGHGLGHGIGLEVHEAPRFAKKQQRLLKAGMVVTVEPGIYFPNWGGVRIEDDVLVTRNGHEVLSSDVPKQLEDSLVQ
jgi:Xaa-Pro aminopeptidase